MVRPKRGIEIRDPFCDHHNFTLPAMRCSSTFSRLGIIYLSPLPCYLLHTMAPRPLAPRLDRPRRLAAMLLVRTIRPAGVAGVEGRA